MRHDRNTCDTNVKSLTTLYTTVYLLNKKNTTFYLAGKALKKKEKLLL